MKLKQALLDCLLKDQLKNLCEELEVEADRRSQEAMVEALASSKRAKPERLIEWLKVGQLKNALELMELPRSGGRDELIERLLGTAGRSSTTEVKESQVAEAGKRKGGKGKKGEAKVTRYTFEDVQEPASPETGHTNLLPDEETVTLPMDNGWSKALKVGKLPDSDRPVVVDMDPAADPVLFWAGKRSRREVPVLPLQRNEIVSESRIAQIIERAQRNSGKDSGQALLFADLEKELREVDQKRRVEFYKHDENWKNKLICGDSLEVMESLMHYEGLTGQVQMIYIDPPYGISYDSNFQQRVDSTKNSRKETGDDTLSVRAFRDTWALRVHSYLSYLEERLYLCRNLLRSSGSIFVQISDENVHLVRTLLDEVFGRANFCSQITFQKTGSQATKLLGTTVDYLLWYAKDIGEVKQHYRQLYLPRKAGDLSLDRYDHVEMSDGTSRRLTAAELRGETPMPDGRRFRKTSLLSDGDSGTPQDFQFRGKIYRPKAGNHWKTPPARLKRLAEQGRILVEGSTIAYKRYADDFDFIPINDRWESMQIGRTRDFVVQTAESVVERCLLMTTRPGDLLFDPTCGSGTTAACAERYGRRWITCDTSRVAINIARQRLAASTFRHYRTRGEYVSSDFVYKAARRITLEALAKDREAEVIDLVDQPEADPGALRVCGPYEIATIGRYSAEDWRGQVVSTDPETGRAALANYIAVIAQLYRKGASVETTTGMIHATAEDGNKTIAISVGPITGRVTAKQINDAVQDALAAGLLEVHVLGWAFEANVGEIKSQLEKRGKVKIELIMIRPDTLAEGLKVTRPDQLFSPLAMPKIEVVKKKDEYTVSLEGVAIFDRKTRSTDYKAAKSGYVSAWYLDEDYDGDCFVDCQMFFDFKKAPNLKATLKVDVDPEEYKLQLESQLFKAGEHKRIAVKVVDVYGNESTVVRELG